MSTNSNLFKIYNSQNVQVEHGTDFETTFKSDAILINLTLP